MSEKMTIFLKIFVYGCSEKFLTIQLINQPIPMINEIVRTILNNTIIYLTKKLLLPSKNIFSLMNVI